MSIFSRIRDSFKRSFNQATSSTTAASQRNERRNQSAPSTATGRVVDNLLTDIAIGFGRLDASDVGQSGIADYNRRTEQSRQAMKDLQERNQRDSGSSTPPPAPAAPTTTTVAEPVTETPEPPAETKQTEAIVRNEAWAKLTYEQQLADLDRRLGKGIGAKKQRARIQYKIDNPQIEIQREKKKKKRGKNKKNG